MQKLITTLYLLLILFIASCQDSASKIVNIPAPNITIQINDLYEDSIEVEYVINQIDADSLIFKFPKIIPGSYRNNNADDYIHNLKCFDKDGKELQIKKRDANTFQILNAKGIQKINYYVKKGKVNSTYDALTKIVATDSFCIINPISVLGFFDGLRDVKHFIEINKPSHFSTFYKSGTSSPKKDRFECNSYDNVVSNPLLYSRPDTCSIINENIPSTVAVYSDNKNITSSLLATWIDPLLSVLNKYTSTFRDNNLPPYRLVFIFSDNFISESALEQENSSVYCLRANWDTLFLKKAVQHLVTHEFLHTITPLGFHSDIYNSELYNDYSSKHLWLYEGVVEYLSLKARLESEQITINEFLRFLSKMIYSNSNNKKCNDMTLLDISNNILSKNVAGCFDKFYSKGALMAFCLDLSISNNSKGENNLILSLQKYIGEKGNIFSEQNFIKDFPLSQNIKDFNIEMSDHELRQTIDSMLFSIGYLFLPKKILWGEYVSHSFDVDSLFIINGKYNITFGINSSLKGKTVELLTLDGEFPTAESINKKLLFPKTSSKLEISFIYDRQNKNILIEPNTVMNALYIDEIVKLKNETSSMKNNLNYFLSNQKN